jgi:hypothetical protein
MPINIVTVCGSVRPGNYTSKALALVIDEFRKRSDVELTPIDLGRIDLAFPGMPAKDSSAEPFRQAVKVATGVVFATPEYHGSFSSVCSHIGAIVLPAFVSVARVQELFDEGGRCLDAATEKRIRSVATGLIDYIEGAVCPKIVLEAMIRGKAP